MRTVEVGAIIARLTVKSETRLPGKKGRFFVCSCSCGGETVAYRGHLLNGSRVSCGCQMKVTKTRHGMAHSPEYKAWENARSRCQNPRNKKFPIYGGRGITMSAEWSTSFEAFIRDMGKRPTLKHTLERLDSNSGYNSENCVWATRIQQNNNRSFNRHVAYQGRSLTIAQASRATGIPQATILGRLNAGKTDEEALQYV
jgi:hypothetical protein